MVNDELRESDNRTIISQFPVSRGTLMAVSREGLRAFLKNEATDLYENKGSALAKIGNEATEGKPSVFSFQLARTRFRAVEVNPWATNTSRIQSEELRTDD